MNHKSDCGVHNAPAYEPEPCDCRIIAASSALKEQAQPIKRCPTCGVWKTPDCFHKCISEESKDGLYFECIACVAEREKEN